MADAKDSALDAVAQRLAASGHLFAGENEALRRDPTLRPGTAVAGMYLALAPQLGPAPAARGVGGHGGAGATMTYVIAGAAVHRHQGLVLRPGVPGRLHPSGPGRPPGGATFHESDGIVDCHSCATACPVDACLPEDEVPPVWHPSSCPTPRTSRRRRPHDRYPGSCRGGGRRVLSVGRGGRPSAREGAVATSCRHGRQPGRGAGRAWAIVRRRGPTGSVTR